MKEEKQGGKLRDELGYRVSRNDAMAARRASPPEGTIKKLIERPVVIIPPTFLPCTDVRNAMKREALMKLNEVLFHL